MVSVEIVSWRFWRCFECFSVNVDGVFVKKSYLCNDFWDLWHHLVT